MPVKKSCFGDDNFLNEMSRGCIRCPHLQECKEVVNKKAYRPSTNWSNSSTTTTAVRRSLSTSTQAVSRTGNYTPAVVRSLSRDSVYNFEKPVMAQLAKYAGYSIAEVCLEELHTLIGQSRENYIEELLNPVQVSEAQEVKAEVIQPSRRKKN